MNNAGWQDGFGELEQTPPKGRRPVPSVAPSAAPPTARRPAPPQPPSTFSRRQASARRAGMNGSAAWALAVGASLADAAQAAWRKRYVLVTLAALTAGGFAATRLLPPFGPSTSPANLPSTAPLPLVDASPAGNPAPQPGAPPGTSPHADPALSAWEAATACRASLAHARATAGATDCRVVAPSALTTVLVRMADPTATVPATVTDGMARLCRAVRDGDAGATDKLLLRSGADPKAVAVFTSGCTALLADTDRMFAEPPPAPSAVPSSENTESREPSFLDDAFGRAPR